MQKRILLAVLCLPTLVRASFEPVPVGARAAGLADAYAVVADDALSLYYNPAGLMQASRPEVATAYGRVGLGLSDGSDVSRAFLAYVQPLKEVHSAVGVGFVQMGAAGLYDEQSFHLGYGREMTENLNAGATFKVLRRSFSPDGTGAPNPVLGGGTSKTGAALDVGAQYRLYRNYSVAMAVRNLNQPNMSLGGADDKAPLGYSLAFGRWTRGTVLTVEAAGMRLSGDTVTEWRAGGERWFVNGVGMRAGLRLSNRQSRQAAIGLSYRTGHLQVDYTPSLFLEGLEGSAGSHMLTLAWRFGPAPVDPLVERVRQERTARERAEAEVRNLRQKLYEMTSGTRPVTSEDTSGVDRASVDALRQAEEELNRLKSQPALPTEPEPEPEPEPQPEPEKAPVPVPVPPAPPKPPAPRPVPPVAPKPPAPRPPKPSLSPNALKEYSAALNAYAEQVRAGATLDQREAALNGIIEKYEKHKIDTSAVRSEINKIQSQRRKLVDDYQLAVTYYRKLIQQGMSPEEQSILLERIIKKYKPLGSDTRALEEELSALQKKGSWLPGAPLRHASLARSVAPAFFRTAQTVDAPVFEDVRPQAAALPARGAPGPRPRAIGVGPAVLTEVAPRVFTPNGDGVNDTVVFTFDNPALVPLQGEIFDLAGAKIVDLKPGADPELSLSWDGTKNGEPAPGGAYFYQVDVSGSQANGVIILAR